MMTLPRIIQKVKRSND